VSKLVPTPRWVAASPRYKRLRKRVNRHRRRHRFFYDARAFTPCLGAEAGSATYIVSTADKNIGRALVVRGRRKEHRHLALSLALVADAGLDTRRNLFLDVGANIGTTAIAAMADHGFRRVLAFEPAPDNFRLLRANAVLNDLDDRMFMRAVAVSDAETTAILDVRSANAASHWLVPGGTERPGRARVPTARLDQLLELTGVGAEDVDLLWIDVEGHEGQVFAGAASLLAIPVPTVFELSPRHLRRAGGLELVLEHVQRFTHLVDLRHPEAGPLPADRIATLLDRYEGYFTDVLAYRNV
jgi:FkbM family methyltransferase